jgi:hypothetical protein
MERMKPERDTICATCAAPVSGMNNCRRCGRPIVRPEKSTSLVVRGVGLATVAVALWLSWKSTIGVLGWFALLTTSMTR